MSPWSFHNSTSHYIETIKLFFTENIIVPFKRLDYRIQLAVTATFALIAIYSTYRVMKPIYICLFGKHKAAKLDRESSLSISSDNSSR